MIATCGHKTDEPISFSYYDGDPNSVSYGSKCFDCFMDTPINYIHNSELVKVRNIIQRQEKIIELLKQSNEFYADINNWTGEDINGWNCTNVIKSEDQEKLETVWVMGSSYPKPDEYDDCGGKLARSIKQQVKELEDKQGEALEGDVNYQVIEQLKESAK